MVRDHSAALQRRSSREGSLVTGHEEAKYHGARLLCWRLITASFFKHFVAVVIVLNTVVVVYETNLSAYCDREPDAAECKKVEPSVVVGNWLFLAVYAVEMALRIFVQRIRYFLNPSDLFDGTVVVVGFASELFGNALPGVSMLRLFRVFRVLRTMKAIHYFEEAKIFISGIYSASKAITVGSILIFFCTFIWAMVTVMLINPVNQDVIRTGVYDLSDCKRCAVAYESVQQAMLTLLQTVVMNDDWGTFAMPIIDHAPWTVFIFVSIQFSVCLGLTNLILAVIMDKALENRDLNLKKEAENRIKMVEVARAEFVTLCEKLDTDKSGFLSLEELVDGLNQEEFRHVLTLLDINKEDLDTVFKMMDRDKSGEVSYEEFSYQLQNLKTQDMHTMISFIKFYVLDLHSLHEAMVNKLSPEDLVRGDATAAGQRKYVEEYVEEPKKGMPLQCASELPPVDRCIDGSCREASPELADNASRAPTTDARETARLEGDGAQLLQASLARQVEELRRRLQHHVSAACETISRELELSVKTLKSLAVELDGSEGRSKYGAAVSDRPPAAAALPGYATSFGGRGTSDTPTLPAEENEQFRGSGVVEPRFTAQSPSMLGSPRHLPQAL